MTIIIVVEIILREEFSISLISTIVEAFKFHPNYRRCKHHLIHALGVALYKAGITAGTYYPNPLGPGVLHVVAADSNNTIKATVVVKPGINGRASIPANYLQLGDNVKAFALTSFDDINQLVEEIAQIIKQGEEN